MIPDCFGKVVMNTYSWAIICLHVLLVKITVQDLLIGLHLKLRDQIVVEEKVCAVYVNKHFLISDW